MARARVKAAVNPVAEPAVAPTAEKVDVPTKALRKKAKVLASKAEAVVEPAAKSPKERQVAKVFRSGSKCEKIMELLRRGVTANELIQVTGWQHHSVRGFLANLKRQGVEIQRTKKPGEHSIYKLI